MPAISKGHSVQDRTRRGGKNRQWMERASWGRSRGAREKIYDVVCKS